MDLVLGSLVWKNLTDAKGGPLQYCGGTWRSTCWELLLGVSKLHCGLWPYPWSLTQKRETWNRLTHDTWRETEDAEDWTEKQKLERLKRLRKIHIISPPPINLSLTFFLIFFYFLTLQYCIGFAIYQHESTTGIHVFPMLNPPPSPYHLSGSSQCTSPKHPVSCIEPGLATRLHTHTQYLCLHFITHTILHYN